MGCRWVWSLGKLGVLLIPQNCTSRKQNKTQRSFVCFLLALALASWEESVALQFFKGPPAPPQTFTAKPLHPPIASKILSLYTAYRLV